MATPQARRVEVLRTHLELRELDGLRPAAAPLADVTLTREGLGADAYRELYAAVGERWHWRDRLLLGDEELAAYLASADVHVWVLRTEGSAAGYFELQRHPDARVEIMYFGLMPAYIGRGLGGWMLTRAVEEAFALGVSRVTLHTCTLDSPAALPNYLARGFSIVRREQYVETVEPNGRVD